MEQHGHFLLLILFTNFSSLVLCNMNNNLLKLGHINIRSLLPKIKELRELIHLHKFDIFCISESWLNNTIDDYVLQVDEYNLIRSDREARGGGVAIYIRNALTYSSIEVDKSIEQLWISIHFNKQKLIVGVLYRPPQLDYKSFTNNLEDSISLCAFQSDSIIFCGDFNIDFLKFDNISTSHFNDFLESINFFAVIDQPTRITHTSATLIDQICTNSTNLLGSSGVIGSDISDHDIIFCEVLLPYQKQLPVFHTFRDYRNMDYYAFACELEHLELHKIYRIDDIDEKVNYFTSNLLWLFNKHAPFVTRKFSKKPSPWLTDNVRLLMKLRDDAKTRFRRTKNHAHWNYYKTLRNLTTSAVRNEKKAYFKFISRDKANTIFKHFQHLNPQSKNQTKINIPAHLSDVDKINTFFLDIGSNTNIPRQNINHPLRTTSSFSFQLVDSDDISKLINNIKSTSTGQDGLNITMIRMCCPFVLPFITHIINSCIFTKTFPISWKYASVIPIAKNTDPKNFKDLRPISVLPTLSKILEKVIFYQIYTFINNESLLPEIQSGFRSGYSCETALLKVTDDILSATDKGYITILTLLDYSKAFDTVDHGVLLDTLMSLGFCSESIQLISSYLSDRKQSVVLGGRQSLPLSAVCGVPQGSVLSPLFFAIYTSNLPSQIRYSSLHMYADDIQLYKSFSPQDWRSAVADVNNDLQSIHNFSKEHNLRLNPAKSQAILFGNSKICNELQSSVEIGIDGAVLPIVNRVRDLGLTLDNSFRYRHQINSYIKSAYLRLRVLYPHRSVLSKSVKIRLCETLILSIFTYCSIIYNAAIDQETEYRIQKVQNSCLRYIFGIRKHDHISHKLPECGWLNMKDRRKVQALCFYHKLLLSKTPPYLYRKVRFRCDVHSITTRYRNLISPPPHTTSLFERAFSYDIYSLYNNLPERFKALSVTTLRGKLKNEILAH